MPLAAIIPTTGPSRGWSGVVSYTHNWNDDWTSNFFVSRIDMSQDLLVVRPSVNTNRVGGNLVYQINDNWELGVELDYLDSRVDPNGTFGFIRGQNLSAKKAFVWVEWQF